MTSAHGIRPLLSNCASSFAELVIYWRRRVVNNVATGKMQLMPQVRRILLLQVSMHSLAFALNTKHIDSKLQICTTLCVFRPVRLAVTNIMSTVPWYNVCYSISTIVCEARELCPIIQDVHVNVAH